MKRILILLLALLFLTGCAAAPAESTPDAGLSVSESTDETVSAETVPEESTQDEGSSDEISSAESVPAEESSGAESDILEEFSLEGFDQLVKIQPYDWYGAPEPDGPGVEFGTIPLSADQQAELKVLLHPNHWEPADTLKGVGLTVVMELENSTTGERLSVCPWDGATLILVTKYLSNGSKAQTRYLAPIWIADDARSYMYEAAYATWPNPQTMKDLSPLCRYPNTLSPEFMAHLAAVEDVSPITWADPFHPEYARIYMPLCYASAISTPWESAEEIPADNLLRAFRSLHFQAYRMDEEFLIDADIADPILQQYFNVSAQHLRSAACFIRDAGCYRMGGADGLGGPIFGPTLLQRTGDNSYRLILEFGESAQDGYYFAFEFELTDTGFRYLRSDGTLYYEEHPLPEA